MACYRDDWPCLVVVPPTLRTQWAAALHRWLKVPASDVKVVHKAAATAKLDGVFNVVSYNSMVKVGAARVAAEVASPSHMRMEASLNQRNSEFL
jgi:hypothetical protein